MKSKSASSSAWFTRRHELKTELMVLVPAKPADQENLERHEVGAPLHLPIIDHP